MSKLLSMKIADLRKLAEKEGIEGYESMETRKELIEALSKTPEPEVPAEEEVEEVVEAPEAPKEVEEVKENDPFDFPGITGGKSPVGSKAWIMKQKLAKQKRVSILIPLGAKEKAGTTTPVTLNGYRLNIMHGTYVEVPEQVAKIIMTSQNQTMTALEGISPRTGKKTRLDGDEIQLN